MTHHVPWLSLAIWLPIVAGVVVLASGSDKNAREARVIALIGALAAWTGQDLSPDALLTLAMNIEAQVIRVPTGVQDYRPALYGGASAVVLDVDGVRRERLDLDLAG